MERHQNHLLKIYSDTLQLAKYKRKLMGGLALGQPPSLGEEDQLRTSSTKLGRCLSKFISEFKRNVEQLGKEQTKRSHLDLIAKLTQDLSNNRELFTQEEAIIAEIKQLMTHWDAVADPLLHYQQGERQEMRNRLTNKLQELVKWEEVNRSAKKPLYLRKLERELRDNLEKIAEEERSFNHAQKTASISVRNRLGKLSGKLIGVIDRMSRESLVNQEKNELLRNYIDLFNDSSHITEKDFQNYRNDFSKTLLTISKIFKQEQSSFCSLTQYVNSLDGFTNQRIKDILTAEDEFTVEMKDMNEEIYSIVAFHEIVELAHSMKELYTFTREWENAKNRMKKVAETLEEAIVAVREFTGKSSIRESRRSNPVEQFIQDKKFMETLVKKEMLFQDGIFEIWRLFFQRYMNALGEQSKAIERSSSKGKGKGRLENAFDRLFISYLEETQAAERNQVSTTLRHSNKAFITEAERFIKTISVFTEELDWSGAYQCSLGPRLLIHGKIKVLPSGIYYESSFNQKNYFFGRTKIFIPKQEIFEINKQTVLVFFPDVLEVVTKYGGVYFHALGKRETMYQHFIDTYLPEVNVQGPREELAFNEFKGDEAAAEKRIEPFMTKLQTDLFQVQLENNSLANIFHKYFANQEFYFQGRTYRDYKTYLCQGVEGKNIKCSGFTPGIPYYFQLSNPQNQPPKDLEQSERLFTYDKKMPLIPFVSKGGDGVCQEKSVFHWGGPKRLVIDIFTIVSGFSLTEGMVVKSRQIFRQEGSSVKTVVSGEVVFQSNSAMNGMIRGPALSNLKEYHQNGMEKIAKMEKNKSAQLSLSSKKIGQFQENDMQGQRIRQLQQQLQQAKTRLKQVTLLFAVIYLSTLLLFAILK